MGGPGLPARVRGKPLPHSGSAPWEGRGHSAGVCPPPPTETPVRGGPGPKEVLSLTRQHLGSRGPWRSGLTWAFSRVRQEGRGHSPSRGPPSLAERPRVPGCGGWRWRGRGARDPAGRGDAPTQKPHRAPAHASVCLSPPLARLCEGLRTGRAPDSQPGRSLGPDLLAPAAPTRPPRWSHTVTGRPAARGPETVSVQVRGSPAWRL